jgi:hypothetical protein
MGCTYIFTRFFKTNPSNNITYIDASHYRIQIVWSAWRKAFEKQPKNNSAQTDVLGDIRDARSGAAEDQVFWNVTLCP